MSEVQLADGLVGSVRTYLADRTRHGAICVDAQRISRELSVPSKQAAVAVKTVADQAVTLSVERLQATEGSATWRVEHIDGPTPFGRDCSGCGSLCPETAVECRHCGRRVNR